MIGAMMVDVDGVVVCGRPSDGRPWAATIEADLGLTVAELQREFFLPYWNEIVIGRDGLIVERGGHRGLLLPQVATEWGFSAERFLSEACRKAGLGAGAWSDPAVRVWRFQAEVFGEEPTASRDA